MFNWYIFCALCVIVFGASCTAANVIWAVNCGGDAHIDANGVVYSADPLMDGVASDHGMSYVIKRVPQRDQIIYQTERYSTNDFAYSIPIPKDGEYVLTLKFSEVWFTRANDKVFDVMLNGEIPIISGMDIFGRVGFATAHDEHIPIRIAKDKLYAAGMSTGLAGGLMTVDFIKGLYDNPKINAIVLTEGTVEDIPSLSPLQSEAAEPPTEPSAWESEEDTDRGYEPRPSRTRAPRTPDPYETADSTYMLLPILVALGAFFPILFCLCRL